MAKHIAYVGLDVHKDTIAVAIAEGTTHREVRFWGTIPHQLPSLRRLVRRLTQRYDAIEVAYEAGPCGYGLYRFFKRCGIACNVVAPSRIPRKPGERIKTDRRDAVTLARLLRSGDLTAVYVPHPEDEAMRDLTRARETFVTHRRRLIQQLKSFLLRHGRHYETGGKGWTPKFRRWLSEQRFEHPALQRTFEEMIRAIEETDARVDRLTEAIREQVKTWRLASAVRALQSFRGIRLVAAATLVAELGDLTRFDNPRQLMSFLGLVPSEHSSGETRRRGPLTKTGNAHARRVLGEVAWAYRLPARVGRTLLARQYGVDESILQVSWKAQVRLHGRYMRMRARGKPKGVVIMAIARELVGFLWAAFHEI
ncbi:MAG: IS110 family transposase, partial [Caldilineae bacterium]